VAVYFFDSSAIFKRYVIEAGTGWVVGITDPTAGHSVYLATITGVEVVSAFVRQTPPLPPPDLARIIADFKYDFHNQYQRVAINDPLVALAMVLAETHGLRGYDAVQLAAGVELNRLGKIAGLPLVTLVSADRQLNSAASTEGLLVEDPTAYP
jgi:predicted nucleic acid-binding protein